MQEIYIVSTGPGGHVHMSLKAKEIIEKSDVVVGYTKYIKDLKDMLEGKERHSTGMTAEIERVDIAIQKALEGKKVSLISNGDVNVFGLATLLVEIIEARGLWDKLDVVSIPGVTSFFAAASLCGAPISQDFAVISLSDRLTPLESIEKRIKAAFEADFVVGIYNPLSKSRKIPYEIFLRYLSAINQKTPVCVATDIGREDENVRLMDAATLVLMGVETKEIDMSTVILVGNSSSRFISNGKILTPRGYLDKYGLDV
ncbi:MAG TPA: precorrin-3B C(17)-methyltransferase [Campylobacterales bacterium]|nr:precorrin-3B C(17)-methyltransferase [Campylobacterales bacterium]